MEEQSDEALILAFREGDAGAFDALLQRYATPLLTFLCRLLGNRAEAEDLFQETFRRVLAKLDTYDSDRRFKPWLYQIAQNLAIDQLRRHQRIPQHEPIDDAMEQVVDSGPTPDEQLDRDDRKQMVRSAVEQLAPRQRATLVLAYFHEMSYNEVAAIMECSVGTVKKQMSRALRNLALHLPEPESMPEKS